MTFPLTPALAYVAGVTKVAASTLNLWRVAISQAIDGTAGGAYVPSPQIDIQGDGLFADPFSGWIRNTKILRVDNGGIIDFLSGSQGKVETGGLFRVLGTSSVLHGELRIEQYGRFRIQSLGTGFVDNGGLVNHNGYLVVSNLGSGTATDGRIDLGSASGPGSMLVGHASVVTVGDLTGATAGSIQVNSQGNVTFFAGATASWAGAAALAQWSAGGTLSMLNTAGAATFANAVSVTGSLATSAASTVNMRGETNIGTSTPSGGGGADCVTIGGNSVTFIDQTTFQAPFGATGVHIGAWQLHRRRILSDADHTLDPQSYDVFVVQNPAAHRTITLSDGPAGQVVYAMFYKEGDPSMSGTHAVDFAYASHGGTLVQFNWNGNPNSGYVIFGWGVDTGTVATGAIEQWIPIALNTWTSAVTINI